MYEMDVVRTIWNGKLILEAPWLLRHFHIFFQAFFNSLPIVLVSIIITEALQPYIEKQISLSILLILSLAVGYILVIKQYSPTVVTGISREQFLQTVMPTLKSMVLILLKITGSYYSHHVLPIAHLSPITFMLLIHEMLFLFFVFANYLSHFRL